MKQLFKYKKYYQPLFSFKTPYPIKLLSSKIKKWKRFNLRKKRRKGSYVNASKKNLLLVKRDTYRWERVKKKFKQVLITKLAWCLYFNRISILNDLNKYKSNKRLLLLLNYFYRPYFNIKVLLWSLYISRSVNEATKMLQHGKVFLNTVKIKNSRFLYKGDIINIALKKKTIQKNINKFVKYLTFVETDCYCFNLVIISNYNDIKWSDLILATEQYYNVKYLL